MDETNDEVRLLRQQITLLRLVIAELIKNDPNGRAALDAATGQAQRAFDQGAGTVGWAREKLDRVIAELQRLDTDR